MIKISIIILLSIFLSITSCVGQQKNINDSNKEKDILVLLNDNYFCEKENWYLYDVVNKTYENITFSEDVKNMLGNWFWDVFSGNSYIEVSRDSERAFYKLYYDNSLKVQYSMNSTEFKSRVLGYPEIKTATGLIKILPLGIDNVPLGVDYLNVEVTLNSGEKKIMPNFGLNIFQVAYSGENTIFARTTKGPNKSQQKGVIIWDYVNDEFYYFKPDEVVIGFGEGAAVVTGKDHVGLSIINAKGSVLYEDKDMNLLADDIQRETVHVVDIRSAYYIHPYILMRVQELGTALILFQIINIETKEYTVLRDGDILYESFGLFVK